MDHLNKTRKVFVVGGAVNYANWMQHEVVQDLLLASLVLFTGGEDVNPALYGEKAHVTTNFNAERDKVEVEAFMEAYKFGIPMIGICRGSQFLCVMAAGKLVQHQSHPGSHKMSTKNGQIVVTSTHHQRQYPWSIGGAPRIGNKSFVLYGWCDGLSPYSMGADGEDMSRIGDTILPDVEEAFYPNINALAIQSHPEHVYPPETPDARAYISHERTLLNRLIFGTL